eukprot:6202686-Pleurochrysis_carterae.AAC.1
MLVGAKVTAPCSVVLARGRWRNDSAASATIRPQAQRFGRKRNDSATSATIRPQAQSRSFEAFDETQRRRLSRLSKARGCQMRGAGSWTRRERAAASSRKRACAR